MGVEAQMTGFVTFDANGDQNLDYAEFKTMYQVSKVEIQVFISWHTFYLFTDAVHDERRPAWKEY